MSSRSSCSDLLEQSLAILIVAAIALEPPLISLYLDLLLATAPHLARSLNPKFKPSLNPKPLALSRR